MNRHLIGHNHPPKSDKVKALAARLTGTTGFNGDQDEIEELTLEECKELDSLVFNCVACNWWCDAEECNEDEAEWVCDECYRDRHPKEDDAS